MLVTVLGVQMDGWAALNLAIQFVLPLLVGLVTTKVTARGTQFVLLGVLTLLTTVATQVLQAHDAGSAINLVQIIVTAVANLAVSLLSHYAVWKPTNLTDLVLSVFVKAPAPAAPVDPAPVDPAPAVARHLAAVPPVPSVATALAAAAPVVDPAAVVSRMAG